MPWWGFQTSWQLDAGKVGTQSPCQMRGDTVDRHCEMTLIQTKETLDWFLWIDVD